MVVLLASLFAKILRFTVLILIVLVIAVCFTLCQFSVVFCWFVLCFLVVFNYRPA